MLRVKPDVKSYHCFNSYYDIEVDVLEGYEYLTGNSETPPQILYIYDQMQKNGYVIGYYGLDLPENWMEKTDQLNQIYSNGLSNIYASETP